MIAILLASCFVGDFHYVLTRIRRRTTAYVDSILYDTQRTKKSATKRFISVFEFFFFVSDMQIFYPLLD